MYSGKIAVPPGGGGIVNLVLKSFSYGTQVMGHPVQGGPAIRWSTLYVTFF
jgi:hypothetical protein